MGPSPVGDGKVAGKIGSNLAHFRVRFQAGRVLRRALGMVTVLGCSEAFCFFQCFRWVPPVGGIASGAGEGSRHRAARGGDPRGGYLNVTEHALSDHDGVPFGLNVGTAHGGEHLGRTALGRADIDDKDLVCGLIDDGRDRRDHLGALAGRKFAPEYR